MAAPYNDDGGDSAGAVYLVVGSASPALASLSTAVQYTGEAAGDGAFMLGTNAGDVDADGYDDVLVGAAGAAYLMRGRGW